jgi:hypothetical protein
VTPSALLDLMGTQFSPLDEINVTNVADLEL